MHNKYKICALVVTYMRAALLKECLNALLAQTFVVDKIYVIDNDSSDGTDIMMKSDFNIPQIEYINIEGGNIGPSACWNIVMKRAIRDAFDWLWLMDDDTVADPKALEMLIRCPYMNDRQTGALLSSVRNTNLEISNESVIRCEKIFKNRHIDSKDFEQEYLSVSTYPLLGILVRANVLERVGLLNTEFVIQADDTDFTLRISDIYKMWIVRDSILIHKYEAAKFQEVKLMGKILYYIPLLQGQWREYYGCRNYLFLVHRRKGTLKFIKAAMPCLKSMLKVLLLADHRYFRAWIYLIALRDALSGKLGFRIKRNQIEIAYDNPLD